MCMFYGPEWNIFLVDNSIHMEMIHIKEPYVLENTFFLLHPTGLSRFSVLHLLSLHTSSYEAKELGVKICAVQGFHMYISDIQYLDN